MISVLNLGLKKWNTIFPGAACVSALVDRFVQSCRVMDIDADSWREKEASEFSSKRSKKQRGKSKPTKKQSR